LKVARVKACPGEPFDPIHKNHSGRRKNIVAIPADNAKSQDGLVSRIALIQIRKGRHARASSVITNSCVTLSEISPFLVANHALCDIDDAELLRYTSAAKLKRFAPSNPALIGQDKNCPFNLECPSARKTANAVMQIINGRLGTCCVCRVRVAAALSSIKTPANRYKRPST